MDSSVYVDVGRDAIVLMLLLSGPILVSALAIGLIISLFQAVTQIQEQTLTFVPKLVIVAIILGLLFPWMTTMMVDYTREIFLNLPVG